MRNAASIMAREPASAFVVATIAALAVAIVADYHPAAVAPLATIAVLLGGWHRTLLRWESLLGGILVVVLFVPIKRYELPASLPFELEPYRVAVAAVVVLWFTSLLIDPRVRLRRSVFDAPLALAVAAIFASELANPGRVQSLGGEVAKSLTFFLSFVFVFYLTVSVIRSRERIDFLVRLLVTSGAIVATFALVERRTGYNAFDHLKSVFPPLEFGGPGEVFRSGRRRVFGSAQHPIAFGAALAMLLPLAVYLARAKGQRLWWVAAWLIGLGVMATGSRTAIVMFVVMALVYLRLKPIETKRLWPVLLPAVVVVHALLPGAIGSVKAGFFPPGGLVAQQTQLPENADPLLAGGRIRVIGPSLDEASRRPLFGMGYGTRITGFDNPDRNAPILDNQWLDSLLQIGLLGFVALAWLFLRAVRRLAAAARAAEYSESWLLTGFAASIAAYGIGMFTFDAFAFIQVTFLFWIILALASCELSLAKSATRRARTEPI